MTAEKKFYNNGLRFECQSDGKCCLSRGKYGYVYVSFGDRRRLAAHFGVSTREFTARYTEKEDGLYQLKYDGEDCPFFCGNHCSVYTARPWQCRTWPFWPENMNKTVWEREVASYCPGAGKGRLYTAEEIEDIIAKRKDVSGVGRSDADSPTARRAPAKFDAYGEELLPQYRQRTAAYKKVT